jgi:hypothetical protein
VDQQLKNSHRLSGEAVEKLPSPSGRGAGGEGFGDNMTITGQSLIVFLIVTAAVVYLGYRVVRWLRRKGRSCCACCQKCSVETTDKPLVQIDERSKTNLPIK